MDEFTSIRLRNVLACILDGVVSRGNENSRNQRITLFTALEIPDISIQDYMERLLKYSKCSTECMVYALIYIDRFIQSCRTEVNKLTVHRLLLTSFTLATKTFDDSFYKNSVYANIGGVPVEDLNRMELEFLFCINFSLYVSCQEYGRYYEEICNHACCGFCSRCHGLDLPVLTYTSERPSSTLNYSEPLSPALFGKEGERRPSPNSCVEAEMRGI